jgi:hypothetical protein
MHVDARVVHQLNCFKQVKEMLPMGPQRRGRPESPCGSPRAVRVASGLVCSEVVVALGVLASLSACGSRGSLVNESDGRPSTNAGSSGSDGSLRSDLLDDRMDSPTSSNAGSSGSDGPLESDRMDSPTSSDASDDSRVVVDGGSSDRHADVPPDNVASGPYRALAIAVADWFACALRDDGAVKCWGRSAPQIDLRGGSVAREIAAAGQNVCAILDDGSVRCWGASNPAGSSVVLGVGRTAIHLAVAKSGLVCALLDDQSVRCGISTMSLMAIKAPNAPAIRHLEFVFGNELMALFEGGAMSDPLSTNITEPRADFPRARAISGCRNDYCWCAAREGGGVFCVSTDGRGAVAANPDLSALAVTDRFLCGIRVDGSVSCWGTLSGCDDRLPQASYWCGAKNSDESRDVAFGKPATSIAAGSGIYPFACAVLSDGGVWCWGGTGETCGGAADGGTVCEAPVFEEELIAPGVEIGIRNGLRTYLSWHAIDLGTRPTQ